ncbi:transcription elongation factor GreAB [Clostridium sp. YIM B02505]|uniref:Transcription elongation factor GreAB n=1 Tax=Clostridium yunnanense TaxID=2800325 RepID=A0ABS1EUN2_9CLOT|nr:transcription elongation factor GreAB [Clostridium yunnanense]MBK1813020.1 transcription elongation factor GreAB [Clostridium yunnanense]
MNIKMTSVYLFLCVIIIVLIAYNVREPQSIKTKPYDGRNLTIGIIGDIPKVREKQVKFTKIQFSDIEKEKFDTGYDAIFITKENLSEAAKAKYAPIYKKSNIPFFFIQTEKSFIPFTLEELSYEDAADSKDQTYITGIVRNGDNITAHKYGLYNDIENEDNIKVVFTNVFQTISENVAAK